MDASSPTPRSDKGRLSPTVRLLSLSSLLNDIAGEMIFPLLPMFLLNVLGASKSFLGIVEGVADTGSSLLKLVSGAWSERAGGRRKFVIAGYALAAFSRPLIGLATNKWHLFACRETDRVGKGIRTAPRDAMISDSTSPDMRGRAFGFHRAMDHLGAAIGPVLATMFLWMWPGQLRALFLVTAIPGLAAVVLLLWRLREPVAVSHSSSTAKASPGAAPAHDGNFRRYLVALAIFTLGNSSDAFLLVRANELGVPDLWLPMLWFVFHIVKSAGNVLAGHMVDRRGARLPLMLGWTLYAGVYLAFAFATEAWHAWALFIGYAVYYALTEPSEKTLVAQLTGGKRQGVAFGWYNFAMGIMAFPASVIFGELYERFGALPAFGSGAALAGVAMLLLSTVRVRAS